MNLILVKMFATALALAQVTTRPESLKTEFDPVNDQAAVVQILKDGCAHMRKAFDIEDLNLDSLIDTEVITSYAWRDVEVIPTPPENTQFYEHTQGASLEQIRGILWEYLATFAYWRRGWL